MARERDPLAPSAAGADEATPVARAWRPFSLAFGDIDGDGKPDLAVANHDPGNATTAVSVLLGNGDGTLKTKVDFAAGTGPYSVITADLNSDGKLDLAVANVYSDNLSILLNGACTP